MKNYFQEFNHQIEKYEHSHKSKAKTKDCSSCKKQVPEKNHKCCSYTSDMNSEYQFFNQKFYQDYYYNSSFFGSQNYFMEIYPYGPLHIVEYIPFGETSDNPLMNEYYKYLLNLYDYYEAKKSKKIKKSKIQKSFEHNELEHQPNEESKMNLNIDHKFESETNQIKDSSQFEYLSKLITNTKKNSKKTPEINCEKNLKKIANGKKYVRNNLKKNKKKNRKKLKEKKAEVEKDMKKIKANEIKKISDEEEKFLKEFKKRLLNRKYIYY